MVNDFFALLVTLGRADPGPKSMMLMLQGHQFTSPHPLLSASVMTVRMLVQFPEFQLSYGCPQTFAASDPCT